MTEPSASLTRREADREPIIQFDRWLKELGQHGVCELDAISMTLATANKNGQPSARIVLLKSYDRQGFVFYTNYNSRKGRELEHNSRVALLFYWAAVARQVRIEGTVEKVSGEESDRYFDSRPVGSRIGAWASEQSRSVENRELLEKRFAEYREKFGAKVPRPPHWGGYRVKPATIEFWQGRDNRLHDRLRYTWQDDGRWFIERLAP